MTHDTELLAIGRIKRMLAKLDPHQRMNVLQYVSNGEFAAQEAAKQSHMDRVADTLRQGPPQGQTLGGNSGAGSAYDRAVAQYPVD
jgi:type IV secretory pathway VirJ component